LDSGSEHNLQQAIAPQLQLGRLELQVIAASDWRKTGHYYSPVLDLTSLNQLSELHMNDLSERTVLPRQLQRLYLMTGSLNMRAVHYLALLPQLQHLYVRHCNLSKLGSLTALSSLQNFSCEVWDYKPDELFGFTQVPLQQLALRCYSVPTTAAANATAWPKLPQLQELHLLTCNGHDVNQPSKQQMTSILAGLTACSSLTKLSFDGSYSPLQDFVDNPHALFLDPAQFAVVQQLADAAAAATGPVSVCGSLASLT
jgi:hypothetical protein